MQKYQLAERSSLPTSQRTVNWRQVDSAFHQEPGPNTNYERHIEEIEYKSTAEDNRVITPCIVRSHPNSGHGDSPRQHPEEVRAQCLDKEPSGRCGKQYGSNLVVQSIEYVAPINSLSLVKRDGRVCLCNTHLPHVLCNCSNGFGL